MTTAVNCASQASQPHQTENAFAPEENTLTLTFNALHALTTVPSVQVKPTAVSVTVLSSFKTQNVLPDAISDTSFQVLFVRNVKKVVHIVKDQEHALSVKLEDMLTTDCAMSTVHSDQLLKPPT